MYEAGPRVLVWSAPLKAKGHVCETIALRISLGVRATESRMTGVTACNRSSSRAGRQLTAAWIPDPEDEAIRDLARALEDAAE